MFCNIALNVTKRSCAMLKRISIQNFKSLQDVTLDLQPVNLLIGPNNSGKSNLLKALESLLLDRALSDEQKKRFFFKHNDQNLYSIKVWRKTNESGIKEYNSSVSTNDNLYGVVEKKVEIKLHEGKKQYESFIDSWHISREGALFGNIRLYENVSNLHDMVDSMREFSVIVEKFGISKIYRPDPNKIGMPNPLIPNSQTVAPDCSNLVSFLDALRDSNPDTFDAIQSDLKICIPEYAGIRFENVIPDEDLKSRFGDKTFKKLGLFHIGHKLTYWAEELSEGTLYFLALLCIVHQPNPPKVLLLEEPERGIHPRRIREVMDFIFRLAEEKRVQVIMTTHSPEVLNEFEGLPEAVFIFDKNDEGATQVMNLQKDVIEPSNNSNKALELPEIKFTDGLGESWLTGFLGGVPK
jgi:predicted ATPase